MGMVSDEKVVGFMLVFATLLVVLVLIIMVYPRPVLPSRSAYLKEDEYNKALASGKVIMLFFYRPDCKICETESKSLMEIEKELPWVDVEWFNMAEAEGDRHVKEEVEKYNVQAIPLIVVRSSKGEKEMLGFLKKETLIALANEVKP